MKVQVLAFATAGDIVGKGPQQIELPDGSKVSDLKRLLTERHPKLDNLWDRLAVAVGGRLVQDDPELEEGQEIALLPPVSGGSSAGDER